MKKRLVHHHFFTDAGESCILGDVGDVAVHVTVDLDFLHHFAAVGLKAAVHVVKLEAGDLAGGEIVYLRRDVFGKRVVVTDLLPAGDEVVAVFTDHAVELRYLVRAVLQVCVHGDDHISGGFAETGLESGGLAVVAAEAVGTDVWIDIGELFDCIP